MNKSTWIAMGAVAFVAAVTPSVAKYIHTWWKKEQNKKAIDITDVNREESSSKKEEQHSPQKQPKPVYHTFS
ncbi:hypothetical protein ABE137_14850 [Brevibacillus laterosporus]|uniref:hypothetical protein n=1 Tax=Brevibacillus laterosporus TaxID=1465 RepID=UPI003D20C0CD